MILMCISPLVFMDEISIQNSSKCVHFLTHLNESLTVPSDWNSVIYTSSYISKILLMKIRIPKKFFRIILPNERVSITLCDGKSFDVIMFESDGFARNVMFYFHHKDPRKTLIYTGPFARYRSIVLNKKFHECVLSGIDRLYIDNTRVNSTDNQTIENVGKTIEDIRTKYPGYQIFMNTPVFGFEDLIFSLANDFKFKIFAGSLQMLVFKQNNLENIFVNRMSDATIIIGNAPSTVEQIQHRFLRKTITLRFIETDYSINYNAFEKIGLYQIHWSPHASLLELYSFIAFIQPYKICRIFKDMPKFPKFLLTLCRKKAIFESSPSYVSSPNVNAGQLEYAGNTSDDILTIIASQEYLTSQKKKTILPRRNSIKRSKNQLPIIGAIKPNNGALLTPPDIAFQFSSTECELNCRESLASDISIPDSQLTSISPIDLNLGENSITEPLNSRNDGQDKAFENDNPEPVNEIELVELSDNGEDVVESNSPVKAGRRNSYLQSPRRPLFPPVPSSPCSVISISSTSTTSGSRKRRRRTNSNSKRKQSKFPGASKHSGRKQTDSPRASTHFQIKQTKPISTLVNKRFQTKLFSKRKPVIIYSSNED